MYMYDAVAMESHTVIPPTASLLVIDYVFLGNTHVPTLVAMSGDYNCC